MFAQNSLGFLVTAAPKPGLILHGVRCSISYHTEIKQELYPSARALQHFPRFYFWVDFPGVKLCNPFLHKAISRRRDEGLGRGAGSVLSSGITQRLTLGPKNVNLDLKPPELRLSLCLNAPK